MFSNCDECVEGLNSLLRMSVYDKNLDFQLLSVLLANAKEDRTGHYHSMERKHEDQIRMAEHDLQQVLPWIMMRKHPVFDKLMYC